MLSSHANDPGLNRGCTHVVECVAYSASLKATGRMLIDKHARRINHNLVRLANLKDGIALAATGVGAVDRARRGMRRPRSVVDIQRVKGAYSSRSCAICQIREHELPTGQHHEPYSVQAGMLLLDIVCQYWVDPQIRFATEGYMTFGCRSLRWVIPKFHIAVHREHCRGQF